jgi:hypothetical protein
MDKRANIKWKGNCLAISLELQFWVTDLSSADSDPQPADRRLPRTRLQFLCWIPTAPGSEYTWAVCFLADECPNSADDSDDDVITDYLVPCEGTGPPMANRHGGPGPLVPTISVTPHSPGGKHYQVLGECNRVACLWDKVMLHSDLWTFLCFSKINVSVV